jgi:hypothetical protein
VCDCPFHMVQHFNRCKYKLASDSITTTYLSSALDLCVATAAALHFPQTAQETQPFLAVFDESALTLKS